MHPDVIVVVVVVVVVVAVVVVVSPFVHRHVGWIGWHLDLDLDPVCVVD